MGLMTKISQMKDRLKENGEFMMKFGHMVEGRVGDYEMAPFDFWNIDVSSHRTYGEKVNPVSER
jgi:hypothetical protein